MKDFIKQTYVTHPLNVFIFIIIIILITSHPSFFQADRRRPDTANTKGYAGASVDHQCDEARRAYGPLDSSSLGMAEEIKG